jgi:hypothetical protein
MGSDCIFINVLCTQYTYIILMHKDRTAHGLRKIGLMVIFFPCFSTIYTDLDQTTGGRTCDTKGRVI